VQRVTNPDPHAILAELGVTDVTRVTPVSGGWDTSLYRVELARSAYALRVFRPEQSTTCQREASVMRTLAAAGLPVPDIRAEGTARGRPALLIDWCAGRTVLAEVRATPWRVWSLGAQMGNTLARIHSFQVSDALADSLPDWTPRVEDALPSLVVEAVSQKRRRAVLHLDFHPLNVMCDGGRISGVLDWANVRIGDPRVDLARTVTLLRLPPTPPGTPRVLDRVARLVLEAAFRRGYGATAFAQMKPFYIWAGAMMERDLRPKLGRPGVWLAERDLQRIHAWTQRRLRGMSN
jgi:aminoglycoside phosphotransferase (APT) family kinase protein